MLDLASILLVVGIAICLSLCMLWAAHRGLEMILDRLPRKWKRFN